MKMSLREEKNLRRCFVDVLRLEHVEDVTIELIPIETSLSGAIDPIFDRW